MEEDSFPPPVAFPVGVIVGTAVTKATRLLLASNYPQHGTKHELIHSFGLLWFIKQIERIPGCHGLVLHFHRRNRAWWQTTLVS